MQTCGYCIEMLQALRECRFGIGPTGDRNDVGQR
jgi:hypothetical protein